MKKHLLLLFLSVVCSGLAFSQKTVTGNVSESQTGEGLPGVTISLKNGTAIGATDNTGYFSITVPSNTNSLVFSSQNFNDAEVSTDRIPMTVRMMRGSIQSLTEVVVTGYGSRSKRSTAGSTSAVTINEVRTQPIASFDQLLQGQSPGVFVKTGSGQPGASADILIRGRGTLNGSSAPLYILDGVQINSADFATLNQGDFESINVLKDAAAASIYGSRAAGGVVVITTRKGRAGKMRINYDAQFGNSSFPPSKLKLMTSAQKLEYELANGNPNNWSASEVDSLSKINTNWEDVFFRKGKTFSHQLSFSGGNERTRYYSSLGYFDQSGVVVATGLKRYTGRINVETGTDRFKVGVNSSFGYSKLLNTNENDEFIGSPLNAIRWSLPYVTPFDENGNYAVDNTANAQPNPLKELLESPTTNLQWKGIANISLEYKLTSDISLRENVGMDYTQNEIEALTGPTTYSGAQSVGGNGSLNRQFNRNFRYMATTSIHYKKTLGKHDISLGLYNEFINNSFRSFGFTGYGLLLPFPNEAAITPGTPDNGYIPGVAGAGTQSKLISYFADADYGLLNRYFLHAGVRRDGSSRFGVNNKYATFYNVGAAWIVSDENFYGRLKNVINLFKVKASYGTVGNQSGIGDFASRPLFGKVNYAGNPGLALNSPGNPNLQWEEKATFNAGFEFAAFRNRIMGSVEYYDSKTKNLFYVTPLSQTTGFTGVLSNAGTLGNKGVEIGLKVIPVRTRNFTWTVDGNFTYNKNTVLALPNGTDTVSNGATYLKIGRPATSFFLVRYAGVDPTNGDPLYYLPDGKTTTNVYSPNDRVFFGAADAPYFGGITNTFNFKGAELSVFWIYSLGNQIFNADRQNVENPAYLVSQLSADLIREWRNPGDITVIPRATSDYQLANTNYFLENGGFWRLRNVRFSYELAKRNLEAIHVNSMKVFIQGENLYTYTHYRGYDPEAPPGGTAINRGAQYPTLRTITIGLNVGL